MSAQDCQRNQPQPRGQTPSGELAQIRAGGLTPPRGLWVVASAALILAFATQAEAAIITWDGGGTDGTCGGAAGDGNQWSCAANWYYERRLCFHPEKTETSPIFPNFSAVSFAAMLDAIDRDELLSIINGEQDTIVANSDAVSLAPGHFLNAMATRFLFEAFDRGKDASRVWRGDGTKFFERAPVVAKTVHHATSGGVVVVPTSQPSRATQTAWRCGWHASDRASLQDLPWCATSVGTRSRTASPPGDGLSHQQQIVHGVAVA